MNTREQTIFVLRLEIINGIIMERINKMDENKEFNDFMSELVQKMAEIQDKYYKLSSANQAKVADVCKKALAVQGINVTTDTIINGIKNFKQ